jgi:hypothetical protein
MSHEVVSKAPGARPRSAAATFDRPASGVRRGLTVALIGGWLALMPLSGQACGACVEDKVAATYDHQVVQRAEAAGDIVVFCEIEGAPDLQRLSQVARRQPGIRAASVRTSANPAAISFAVNPNRLSPQAAVDAAQRSLGDGARLTILRLLPDSRPVASR